MLESSTSKSEKNFLQSFGSEVQKFVTTHYCVVFDSRGLTDYLEVLVSCDQLLLGALPTIIGDISI